MDSSKRKVKKRMRTQVLLVSIVLLFVIAASSAMAAPTHVNGRPANCICPCPPAAAGYRPGTDPNPYTLYVNQKGFDEWMNYMSPAGYVRYLYYRAFGVMLDHHKLGKLVAMSKRQAAAGQFPPGQKSG